jgi:hypothetical protein
MYRRGVETAEIAVRTGIGVAEVEEFELVGLPSAGLPPLLERERMKLRAAMVGDDPELERRATLARSAEELAEVRVQTAKVEADRVVKAIGAGVVSKSDEARLAKANRTTALAMATLNANLLRGAVALSEIVGRELAGGSGMDATKALRALTMVSTIAKTTAETARIAVQLERLAAGEPTSIVGHVGALPDPQLADMSPEEGQRWLEIANKAFARRALRSTVLDGTPIPELAG